MRNSFLRVPPNHTYAAATQSNREFDRFGLIRTTQRTYVRGGAPQETIREHCREDADCGIGGACEPVDFADGSGGTVSRSVCVGGLTEDRGETDLLTFYRPRHNFFRVHLTEQACVADWECDGRYDDAPGAPGSVCDRAARRCTVPLRDRERRQVAYHLNAGFPAHLVKPAFRTMGDWNEVFMRGWRATQGESIPEGPAVSCQNDDPTAYCFCGSPDDTGGSCSYRYDPFQTPEAAAAAGVVNPYRCHVENTAGWDEPASPTSLAEYGVDAYQWEFVGDECLFVLESNSCDRDAEASCEELGDIRYQFFNYITHGNVFFGGVATPMIDPTNGEFIYSSVNMAAESIESVGTVARDFFPVLREEPGANDEYVDGEYIRSYYSNLGNTENPISVVQGSAFDGYALDDDSRPGLPVDMHSYVREVIESRLPHIERLRGLDGRASVYSDRMLRLAETPFERRLLGSLGQDGWDGVNRVLEVDRLDPALRPTDDAVMDLTSPFRSSNLLTTPQNEFDARRSAYPRGIFFDPPFAPDVESARFGWWAEQFRDRPLEEATIRMQQKYLEGVMHHEVGHGVGLHHNFAGSFDRNQYHDGYYHAVVDDGETLAIPEIEDYDNPALGGDASGFVTGEEINAYFRDLRRVREQRNALGLGRYTTSSVMEYHGDLGIIAGIGKYDVAATIFNHFDRVEVYDGDPRLRSDTSLAGVHRSHETPRSWFQYYRGGESCDVDNDCPSGPDNPAMSSQPVYQRCIRNPRRARLPAPCSGDTACVCSSFDEDMLDFQARTAILANGSPAYVFDANTNGTTDGMPDGVPDHFAVPYLFCTGFRSDDISWCSTNDAGESFQESVDHYRREWEQAWPLAYNRTFPPGWPHHRGNLQRHLQRREDLPALLFPVLL